MTRASKAADQARTVLDGGMGQELVARGVKDGPLWSAEALVEQPELIKQVHRDFAEAGARVLTTFSYALGSHRLETLGIGDRFAEYNIAAGRLAREVADEFIAVGVDVKVAGSLPPYRGSYRPATVADRETLLSEYRAQAELLHQFVDLFVAETMSSIDEGRAATDAARGFGLPVWVAWTMTGADGPTIASGESIADAVEATRADAYLLNCTDPERITIGLEELVAATKRPVGAYANGFAAIPEGWDIVKGDPLPPARADLTPGRYVEFVDRWIDMGVSIIGGCCEVGPNHIAAIAPRITR